MADEHEHENGHGIRRVDGPDESPCYESTEFPGLRGLDPRELAVAASRIRTRGATLYLSGLELVSLPAELGQCTRLKVLDCSRNRPTKLPAELDQGAALETIYCRYNQLTELPAGLGQCASLKELDCGFNNLTSLPAALGQCLLLKRLNCSCNRLTELPAELGKCASLENLDCDINLLAKGTPRTPKELRARWERWEEVRPHTKSAAKQ